MARVPVRNRTSAQPGLTGTVRVDRRTKVLLPRLRPGDIAVLDHLDLDRASAQALVDAKVSAVLNVSQFLSGRYPALGPALLAEAGILMVDRLEGLQHVPDGSRVRVHDEMVYVDEQAGRPRPGGRRRRCSSRRWRWPAPACPPSSRRSPTTAASSSAARSRCCSTDRAFPRAASRLAGRPAIVVVEGKDHRAELRRISAFVARAPPGHDRRRPRCRRAAARPATPRTS